MHLIFPFSQMGSYYKCQLNPALFTEHNNVSHLIKLSLKTQVLNVYNNILPYEGAIIYLNILLIEYVSIFFHF